MKMTAKVFCLVLLTACLFSCGDKSNGSEDASTEDGASPPEPLSWSSPQNISNTPEFSDIKINWGNSMASSADGTVHVAWREVFNVEDDVIDAKIVHRRLSGGTWSDAQDISEVEPGTGHPKIAASGSHVYIAWHTYFPAPAADDRINLSVSAPDGGLGTFSAPQIVVTDAHRSSLNLLHELSSTPSIAADNDWVYIVWPDERNVDACGFEVSEVYMLSSPDSGETWESVRRVSEPDCRSSWTPSVTAWDDTVHVAWTDDRHSASDCGLEGSVCQEEEYYRRLADNGEAPGPADVRLTHDAPGSGVQSWAPNITALGELVHVVWFDKSGGDDFEVYHLRSADRGQSWPEQAYQLSAHEPGCASARPVVAACGNEVHAVWFDICGDSEALVFHAWSNDRGSTWSDFSDVTSGTGVFAIQPYVACHEGLVHVVWTDSGEIYYTASG